MRRIRSVMCCKRSTALQMSWNCLCQPSKKVLCCHKYSVMPLGLFTKQTFQVLLAINSKVARKHFLPSFPSVRVTMSCNISTAKAMQCGARESQLQTQLKMIAYLRKTAVVIFLLRLWTVMYAVLRHALTQAIPMGFIHVSHSHGPVTRCRQNFYRCGRVY